MSSSSFKGDEFIADMSTAVAEGHTRFTCLSRKLSFDVPTPEVTKMRNGRYIMRVACPWLATNGRPLTACKFASRAAYESQAKEEEASDASSSSSATEE
jgi:hypothetical protein